MEITYKNNFPDEEGLHQALRAIYHSTEPGYFVFRQFISPEIAQHIVKFYTEVLVPDEWYQPFISNSQIRKDCPNFFKKNSDLARYYNFFWNLPSDEVTYSVAFAVQILRNLVESQTPYSEIFPLPGRNGKRSASFRVLITRSGSWVSRHADWQDSERVQATLYLSKRDKDYSGDGFVFTNNQGKEIVLSKELSLNPGDLVFWRYSNVHHVKDISTTKEQVGFVRIIFPPPTFLW